jgi:hypothetical protein
MTEEELNEVLDDMYRMFANLPSPEHEPKQFAAKVKLYKHLKKPVVVEETPKLEEGTYFSIFKS